MGHQEKPFYTWNDLGKPGDLQATKALQSIPGYFPKQSKHSKYFLGCFDCFEKHPGRLSKAAKALQVFLDCFIKCSYFW